MTSLISSFCGLGRTIYLLRIRMNNNKELILSLQQNLECLLPIINSIKTTDDISKISQETKRHIEKRIDKIIRYLHKRLHKNWLTRVITSTNEAQKLQICIGDFLISLNALEINQLQNLLDKAQNLPMIIAKNFEESLNSAIQAQTNEIKAHIDQGNKNLLIALEDKVLNIRSEESEKQLLEFMLPYIDENKDSRQFWGEFRLKSELNFDEFFRYFLRNFLNEINPEFFPLIELALKCYFPSAFIHHTEINNFFMSVWAFKHSKKELIRRFNVVYRLESPHYKLFFRAITGSSAKSGNIARGSLFEIPGHINRNVLNDRAISQNPHLTIAFEKKSGYIIKDSGSTNQLKYFLQHPCKLIKGTTFTFEINNSSFDFFVVNTQNVLAQELESSNTALFIQTKQIITIQNLDTNEKFDFFDTVWFKFNKNREFETTFLETPESLLSLQLIDQEWVLFPLNKVRIWVSVIVKGNEDWSRHTLHSWTRLKIGSLEFKVEFYSENSKNLFLKN